MIDDDDLLPPRLGQPSGDETRVNVRRGSWRGVRNNSDRLLRVFIRLGMCGGNRQRSQYAQYANTDPIPTGDHLILPAYGGKDKAPKRPFPPASPGCAKPTRPYIFYD